MFNKILLKSSRVSGEPRLDLRCLVDTMLYYDEVHVIVSQFEIKQLCSVFGEDTLKKARFDDTVNYVASTIRQNGNTYDFLQTARKKARALYAEERRQHKEYEAVMKAELQEKFQRSRTRYAERSAV